MKLTSQNLLSVPTPPIFSNIGYEDEYLFLEYLAAFINNQLCKNSYEVDTSVSLKLVKNGFDIKIHTVKNLTFFGLVLGIFWIPTRGFEAFDKSGITQTQLDVLVDLISAYWNELSDAFIESGEVVVNNFNLHQLVVKAGLEKSIPVYTRDYEVIASAEF